MKTLIENQGGAGAKPIGKLHRIYHKAFKRNRMVKGVSFDFTVQSNALKYGIRQLTRIKNQGQNDSCGGQSGSVFLFVVRYIMYMQGILKNADIMQELSAKSIYAPIASIYGGTTIAKLMTQIAAHGVNLEAQIPSYDAYGNPLTESLMRDISWETDALTKEALTRSGFVPINVSNDIDSVAQAIDTYGAVIWEIHGQNGNTPGWLTARPSPYNPNNKNDTWDHFMCAFDYQLTNGKKEICAFQSEGTNWGDRGIQYFGEEFFNKSNIVDCFTFAYDQTLVLVDNPNLSLTQRMWQSITLWFRQQSWLQPA